MLAEVSVSLTITSLGNRDCRFAKLYVSYDVLYFWNTHFRVQKSKLLHYVNLLIGPQISLVIHVITDERFKSKLLLCMVEALKVN
jgi:hypothetical protein